MKNKFLLILVAIILISGVITTASFFIFDRHNFVYDGFDFDSIVDDVNFNPKNLVHSNEFDKIKEIEISSVTMSVDIKKGSNKIEFYNRGENNLDYNVTNGKLTVTQKGKVRDSGLIIFAENLKDVNVKVRNLTGTLDIEGDVKSLDINDITGTIDISSKESFDINLKNVTGTVDMEFDKIDALVTIDKMTSTVNVMGEDFVSTGNSNFSKEIGKGRDKINIENITGILDIEEN